MPALSGQFDRTMGQNFFVIANHIFSLPGTDHLSEILRVKNENKEDNHFYSSVIIH